MRYGDAIKTCCDLFRTDNWYCGEDSSHHKKVYSIQKTPHEASHCSLCCSPVKCSELRSFQLGIPTQIQSLCPGHPRFSEPRTFDYGESWHYHRFWNVKNADFYSFIQIYFQLVMATRRIQPDFGMIFALVNKFPFLISSLAMFSMLLWKKRKCRP